MRRTVILLLGFLFTGLPVAFAQDAPGCADHPLLSRMKNFHIDECETQEFGEEEMYLGEDESRMVEGKRTVISYSMDESAPRVSELQVKRNYTNAITKLGGKLLYEDRWAAYLRLEAGGKDTWIRVRVYGGASSYDLCFVEVEAMRQDVTAGAMLKALNDQGFVALYINFDTDKAVIKPESEPVLAEMAKLLKDNPGLNVFIVGHTDSTGSYEHNLKLSQERAAAVVSALVSPHGIAASRLTAVGVGPVAPVATNDSEDGRAMNRRVELVKR